MFCFGNAHLKNGFVHVAIDLNEPFRDTSQPEKLDKVVDKLSGNTGRRKNRITSGLSPSSQHKFIFHCGSLP